MKSREYWERRALLRKVQAERGALRTADEIGEAYDRAAASLQKDISYWLSRFADNNALSLADAKRLLKADELKEFRWTVEEYISHGENNLDGRWARELENASARVHISRLETMQTLLRAQAEELAGKELSAVESLLSDTYRDQYLKRAFDLQKGLGIGWNVQAPDPRMVKILLKKPWAADGTAFSDRIWKDKERLVRELDRALTQSLITGKSPDAAAKVLADKLGAGKRQARRLVFTEAAAVSTLAEKDCYTDLGVGEYEILATLDSKTSEICRSMDGRHFPVSEMKPGITAPPFHPNCRTDTCPYFDDMVGERFARDAVTGESFMVPGNMTYAQWKARQDEIHGEGTVDKMRKISYNEAADREQFEKYRERLGADAPKSFAAFQQIKYNSEDYKDLTGYYRYKGANPTSDKRFWNAHKAVKILYDEGKIRTTGTLVAAPLGRVAVKANEHAEKRFASRGITLEWVQNIIDNAAFAFKQRKGTQYAFYTSEGFAVLDNNNGEVGTAGQLDERGKLLYDEVMKYVRAR